jgi:hypothetical protein
MRQSRRYQTQWTAQFYAAAELTRRGYLVAFTLGNAPATDLLVSRSDGKAHFRVDVKRQSTRNFWLVRGQEVEHDLYYVLVYIPRNLADHPQYFILSSAEMTHESAQDRRAIESRGTEYRENLAGMNWSAALKYKDRWNILPH